MGKRFLMGFCSASVTRQEVQSDGMQCWMLQPPVVPPVGIVLPRPVHLYVGQPLGHHALCNFSMVSISPAAGPSPLLCHCQEFPSINVPTELPPHITWTKAASCHREAACDCRDVPFDDLLGKGLTEGWKKENETEVLAACLPDCTVELEGEIIQLCCEKRQGRGGGRSPAHK